MTRDQRYAELKTLWEQMPFKPGGITNHDIFWQWQGTTAALLGFNSHLQTAFRDVVKSISEDNSPRDGLDWSTVFKVKYDRFNAIFSEAIHELSIPDEPVVRTLAEEHGIFWFFAHCTWASRLALLGIAVTIFCAGLRFGMIDEVKNLYIKWSSPQMAQPIASPTPAQPTK